MVKSTAPTAAKGAKSKSSHRDDQKKRSSSHSTPTEAVKSAAKAQAQATKASKHTKKDTTKDTTKDRKKQPEAAATAAQLLAGLTSGDFPRGGGSALTAAEYRDTLQTARADAAEEAFQRGPVDASATTSRKRPHRRGDTDDDGLVHDGRSRKRRPDAPNAGARIEHLNYKRLSAGTKLIGTILAVHPLALIISLPDGLLGHVPITNISAQLTQRLRSAAEASDSDSDGETSDSGSESDAEEVSGKPHVAKKGVPELVHLFKPGQMVVTAVETAYAPNELPSHGGSKDTGAAGRDEYDFEARRAVLSLDPALVNAGVDPEDLSAGSVLPVTIASKEDNGWVVETGVKGLRGFLPFKDNKKWGPASEGLAVGSVQLAAIESIQPGSVAQVRVAPHAAVTAASLGATKAPRLEGVLPGTRVRALVSGNSPAGISVKLWGLFDATLSAAHLPNTPESYTPGSHVDARILWVQTPQARIDVSGVSLGDEEDDADADAEAPGQAQDRKLGLSAVPHILKLEPPADLALAFPVGVKADAVVTAINPTWGLTLALRLQGTGNEVEPVPGFAHISRVQDDHISRLDANSYGVGSTHVARVIRHSLTDQVVEVSLAPRILNTKYLRVADVPVGIVIRGIVKQLKEHAIFIDFGGPVDGIVFPLHFSDVALKKPERKFPVGSKVTARVIVVEPAKSRVGLSLKTSIVRTEQPIPSLLSEVHPTEIALATVSKQLDKGGVLVDFFQGLRAFVPRAEVSNSTSPSPVRVGQTVQVRVLRIEETSGRITASIRQALPSYVAQRGAEAIKDGTRVSGTVASVQNDVAVLSLPHQPGARAVLSLNALAQARSRQAGKTVTVEELDLDQGTQVNDLVVTGRSKENSLLIVVPTTDQSAVAARAKSGLVPDMVLDGTVLRQIEPTAVGISFGPGRTGRLHVFDVADRDALVDAKLPEVGSTVHCVVLRTHRTGRGADVSTAPAALAAAARATLSEDIQDGATGLAYEALSRAVLDTHTEVKVGDKLVSIVRATAPHAGLFVDIARHGTGRIMISQLFDTFVQEWTTKFTAGQVVHPTVTKIVGEGDNRKVELSLKSIPSIEGGSSSTKASSLKFSDLVEGQAHTGFVRNTTDFGVFVQLDNSTLSGLAHKSTLADPPVKPETALKAYSVGDRVMAKITKLNRDSRKISLGLKRSLFTEKELDQLVQPQVTEEEAESGSDDGQALPLASDDDEQEESSEEDEDSGSEGDDESDDVRMDQFNAEADDEENESDSEEDDDDDDDDEQESDEEMDVDEQPAPAHKLELSGGYSWSGNAAEVDSDDAPSAGESDDEDGQDQKSKSKSKKPKGPVQDVTGSLATQAPESASDFERLLLGSPNSSLLWIRFMSFYLSMGDVDRARSVAERALTIINFREETERLNVWLARLNLENAFGAEDGSMFDAVLVEASRNNDAQTVALRATDMLQRSGKLERASELWQRTARKFSQSASVWAAYYKFLLETDQATKAREVAARSLQSLPSRKHVKVLLGYALNEYRTSGGDTERGRVLFEGLVDTHAQRLDLWMQYLDQEEKLVRVAGRSDAGAASRVRSLFERLLARKLSSKKARSVLKKWLGFEKKHGTPADQQAVLQRARDFVAAQHAKSAAATTQEATSDSGDESAE